MPRGDERRVANESAVLWDARLKRSSEYLPAIHSSNAVFTGHSQQGAADQGLAQTHFITVHPERFRLF